MRLSNFILQNIETILQEWQEFAASLVPESQASDQVMLRDHVKQMLESISADLARPDTTHEKSEKSKGHRPPHVKTAAATHGADRLSSGFSLAAAMAEYRALRASVTRLWQEAYINKPVPQIEINDLIRFNEAIDEAISESVASYSFEKEQATRVLDTILSSLPDLSYIFDLEGRFTYANKAMLELLDLPLNEIVGKNYIDLGLPGAADWQEKIQQVISSKETFRAEMVYQTPPAEAKVYDYILVAVLDEEGAVEAVVGTARNILDRSPLQDKNWRQEHQD